MISLSNISVLLLREPSADDQIKIVESNMSKSFPENYMNFLRQTSGFDSDQVRLYPVEELEERNATYEVDKYCPNFINIGDDGKGGAIMLNISSFHDNKVYLVGHGVMTTDHMEVIGSDFADWLESGCTLSV